MKRKVKSVMMAAVMLAITVGVFAGGTAEKQAAIQLRFIDVSPSPTRQTYFTDTFAKFKQETGITVVYESVPWDDAANKLTVLGTSKQLPDVITTWAGWLGQFTEAGWVVPLSDYIGNTTGEYAST
jgi:multiple sugar transport system substrate-binding protein